MADTIQWLFKAVWALWGRPGLVRSILVPYDDMVFVGVSSEGVVLVYEKERRGRRARDKFYLAPWVLSHRSFRDELKLRAPRVQMNDDRLMHLRAFRSRMGALGV